MGLSPAVCFASQNIDAAIKIAVDQSRTTHASVIAEECCKFTAAMFFKLLSGADYRSAKPYGLALGLSDDLRGAISESLTGVYDAQIPFRGYVLDSLQASLWCIENSDSFESAVLLAVNLGDDADTAAAITGQIAGALYGYFAFSAALKDGLKGERRLYVTSQFLAHGPQVEASTQLS